MRRFLPQDPLLLFDSSDLDWGLAHFLQGIRISCFITLSIVHVFEKLAKGTFLIFRTIAYRPEMSHDLRK